MPICQELEEDDSRALVVYGVYTSRIYIFLSKARARRYQTISITTVLVVVVSFALDYLHPFRVWTFWKCFTDEEDNCVAPV